MAERVVVTGIGIMGPVGCDREAFLSAILNGESGVVPDAFQDLDGLAVPAAAIDSFEPPDTGTAHLSLTRMAAISLVTAREAATQAHLLPLLRPDRAGVYFGAAGAGEAFLCSCDPGRSICNQVAHHSNTAVFLANEFGLRGQCAFVNTACCAASHAIALAVQDLRRRRVDVALAGGADPLTETAVSLFGGVGALDDLPTQPYGRSTGLSLGEGGAFLVLESEENAVARGAAPIAELCGFGLSADAYHPTAPDPSGRGAELAIRRALSDAGVALGDLTYINGHGTGTRHNDRMEQGVYARLSQEAGRPIAVSATKAATGHALGGSAAMEAALACLAVARDVIPPTAGLTPSPQQDLDIVGSVARRERVEYSLSLNCAFGGDNTALLFGKPLGQSSRSRAGKEDQGDIYVTGIGVIGNADDRSVAQLAGIDIADPRDPLYESWTERIKVKPPRVRNRNWMRMDNFARLAAHAVELALEETSSVSHEDDEIAVIVASVRGSETTYVLGPERSATASPFQIANTNVNAVAGHISTAHTWRGPTMTILGDASAGVTALLFAYDLLKTHAAKAAVVVSADIFSNPAAKDSDQPRAIATACVLERIHRVNDAPRDDLFRLCGGANIVGHGGPSCGQTAWQESIKLATENASIELDQIRVVLTCGPEESVIAKALRCCESAAEPAMLSAPPPLGSSSASDACLAMLEVARRIRSR